MMTKLIAATRLFHILASCILILTGARTLAQQPTLKVQTGHSGAVLSIDYGPEGKLLASGGADHAIKLWDAPTGKEIMTFRGHQGQINSVAFSPDGKLLASGSSDGTLRIWEVETGKNTRTLYAHLEGVQGACWHPMGQMIYTGGKEGVVKAWDLVGREKGALSVHTGAVSSLACNPNGQWLASAGDDHSLQIINLSTFQTHHRFPAHTQAIHSVAFSPSGKQLATAGEDRMVKVWDTGNWALKHVLFGHAAAVNSVAFDAEGRYLFSGGADGALVMWDVEQGNLLKNMEGHRAAVNCVKAGQRADLIASGSDDRTVATWNIITGKMFQKFTSYAAPLLHASYSPKGDLLAFCGGAGDVFIWDALKGRILQHLKGHQGKVNQVAFSPDGHYLASVGADQKVVLWNVSSGRLVRILEGHHGPVEAVAFHPNGGLLFSGGSDQTIRSWETLTGQPSKTYFGHLGQVNALAIDSAGNLLASASEDGTARLWNIQSGQQLALLQGHMAAVNGIDFSPLGDTIATASDDQTIKLWDAASGKLLHTLAGTGSPITSVAFNADGSLLVSGSANQLVQVWGTQTNRRPRIFFGHEGSVNVALFSPNQQQVVSVGDDQQLKVWRLEDGEELVSILPAAGQREFVLTSPGGGFDGTEEGVEKSLYFVQGTHVIPLASFYEKYYTPGLWRQEVLGEELPEEPAGNMTAFSLPPEAYFTYPRRRQNIPPFTYTDQGLLCDTAQVALTIEAYDQGGGIDEIQLFQNGKLVATTDSSFRSPAAEGEKKQVTFAVTLVEGVNKFTTVALNNQRTESVPDFLNIAYKSFIVPESDLFIFTIGIDEYKNKRYNLNYAKSDAQAIEAQVQKGGIGIYRNIYSQHIFDEEATAENIRMIFADIMAQADEKDVFVFFYAGHGVMSEGQDDRDYYLCPHDITKLYGNDRMLKSRGISATELKELCKGVKAQKQLILLDACQSGGAASSFSRRGVIHEKAIVQLARSTGIALIAASDSEQFAAEVEELGHGVFTYSILRALQGAADSGVGDKKITVGELRVFVEQYIPELSEKHKGVAQYPTVYTSGQDFPISVIE